MVATPQSTSVAETKQATASSVLPALRNALAAALVAFGLCFPIISYHAEANINNELVLTGRWPMSFGVAALVFVFVLFRQMSPPDWRVWFDRFGSVAAGGMGGALAESAREGEGVAPPSRARRQFRQVVRAVRARFRRAVPADHARAARARRLAEMDQQLRRPDHDLRHAGLGPEHRGRARRACSISATSPSTRSAPIPMRCCRPPSACRSGSACRSPASSPRCGESSSASRCCGCAATISPS